MFRYGSSFWSVSRRPRALSNRPKEAEAIPLPSDDTTPPVTTTIFAIALVPLRKRSIGRALPERRPSLFEDRELLGRVHAGERSGAHDHLDSNAMFQRAQLLEPLGPFQRARGPCREFEEQIAPKSIDANVAQCGTAARARRHVGPAKVER